MNESPAGFRRKQAVGAVLSAAAMWVIVGVARQAQALFGSTVPAADDLATRLAFAVDWLLAPGCTLLVGIVVAARRGFYVDAIDGTRTPSNRGLEIGLRYNQNTLEQTVLAAIAWPGLAVRLPHAALALIPAMAALFVLGRATFWIGYLVHPVARAFGMVLTMVPTWAAYGWLVARLF